MARTAQTRERDPHRGSDHHYHHHHHHHQTKKTSGAMPSTDQASVMLPPLSFQTPKHSRSNDDGGGGSGSKAKVHSYNSFKQIIEGKTFHPEDYSGSSSHSRESSQASNGGNGEKTPKKCPERDQLGVLASEHSSQHQHQHDLQAFNRPPPPPAPSSPKNDYELKHAHRVRLKTESELGPTNVHMAPEYNRRQYSPRDHTDEFNHYDLSYDQDYLHRRQRSSGSQSAPKVSSDLPPQVHRGNLNRRSDLPLYQFNHEDMVHYERTDPDGIECLQPIPSVSEEYHSVVHTRYIPERPPPPANNRPVVYERRAKIRRQTGVHVKDDVPMFKGVQARPKSDYIVRPNRDEVKARRGQKGHVNSAFVEDRADSEFEYLKKPEDKRVTKSQRPDWNRPNFSYVVSRNAAGPSRGDVNPHVRQLMRKTVNEARKEKEDLLEMRRRYARNKLNASQNVCPVNQSLTIKTAKDSPRIQTIPTEGNPVDIATNNNKDHKSSHDKEKKVKRKVQNRLSKNPRDSVSITLENNNDLRPWAPELGLQKYVKAENSDKPFGTAIMVHMSPPLGLTAENLTDKKSSSSPVVINVGEMTWERIKRQISKKNTYEVQKETKESLKEVQKPPVFLGKPKTHFTLSLFTLCFCLSPFGLLAMLFAVCSASAYKDRDAVLGKRLSRAAFALSIIGILGTLATAAILIGTNTIPVLGRYQEPDDRH